MKHPFRIDQCKSCRKTIVWAKGPNGHIPLDPLPATYWIYTDENNATAAKRIDPWDDRYPMISHFYTCPDASKFSKKRP